MSITIENPTAEEIIEVVMRVLPPREIEKFKVILGVKPILESDGWTQEDLESFARSEKLPEPR